MGLLVVCTANICRSPLVAAVLARPLSEVPELSPVESAGLLFEGRPADPGTVAAAADLGLDVGAHSSRIISRQLIGPAALILGMERRHVREVAVLEPAAWAKTFTLKELVRRGRAVGGRRSGQALADWLAEVGEGRRPAELMADDPADDVDDPIGQGPAAFRRMAEEVSALGDQLVSLLSPR